MIRDTGLSSNVLNCGCDCGFVAIPVDVGDCEYMWPHSIAVADDSENLYAAKF